MIKHFSTWCQKDKDEYIELWKKHNHLQLQRIYGCHEKTITNINRKLGLKVGVTHGKKYSRRKDRMSAGTIVLHNNNKTGRKFAYIITEDFRERLHIYNWKQAGNEIPDGYLLGYKNPYIEDPIERDSLDNLELKTRQSVILDNIRIRKTPIKIKPVIDFKPPREKKPRKARERKIKPERQKVIRVRIKEPKPKVVPPPKQPVIKPVKQSREAIRPTPKRVDKVYKTVHRDFSKLIPVRIDHKTIVYARSEQEIPKILQRFSKAI
jgi:hypothetical protein